MTTNRKLVEEVYADVKSGKAPLIIEFQMGAHRIPLRRPDALPLAFYV